MPFNPRGINIYKGIFRFPPNYRLSSPTLIDVWPPPSWSYHNNRVVFGSDGKMFWPGTATNSVVARNAGWVKNHPQFHIILEHR